MPVTEEIKKALLNHFEYEVDMIREGFSLIRDQGVHAPNSNIVNIDKRILIDFLTHVRILHEFFYGSWKNEKIGHAGHYIEDYKNKRSPQNIGEWNGRINDYLSHLAYARVNREQKPWPHVLLYSHFRKLIIDFLDELNDGYLTDTLRELSTSLKAEIYNN